MTMMKRSRVVITPLAEMPYKVVLEHQDGTHTEQPVATICEGEALIRSHGSPQFSSMQIDKERECPLLHGG